MLPFLALSTVQSSCNPRSLIHNSGCGSHWRRGGGEGGGLWVSLPPGLAGAPLGRGSGGWCAMPCRSLPPPPSVPARRVPFSFPTPCFPRLLTITPSSRPCLFSLPEDHTSTPSPHLVTPWQRLGQDAKCRSWKGGYISGHQEQTLLISQTEPLKAGEGKGQFRRGQLRCPDPDL